MLVIQTVFGSLLKGIKGPIWQSWYFWVFLVATLGSGVLALCQKASFDKQQAKYQTLLDDQLEPLIRLLITICEANAKGRREELSNFIKTATNVAAGIVPSKGTRASVFEVVHPASPKNHAVPYMRNKKGSETGRGDLPQSVFYKDRGEGAKVWDNMLGAGYTFCADTRSKKNIPQGWDPNRKRRYRSFISVSIESSNRLYGMLTINTPEVNKLKEEDINSMQVVAGLIAAAFTLCRPKETQFFELDRQGDAGAGSTDKRSQKKSQC